MRFDIRVVADGQALPRVWDHFAPRTLLPSRMVAELVRGKMSILVEVPELDAATAQLIVEKLRSSVLVEQALFYPCPSTP